MQDLPWGGLSLHGVPLATEKSEPQRHRGAESPPACLCVVDTSAEPQKTQVCATAYCLLFQHRMPSFSPSLRLPGLNA